MTRETFVTNRLLKYLRKKKFKILQFVAPGTQAGLSIYYRDQDKNVLVFPDILCRNKDTCFVGEAKPSFSKKDVLKLEKLARSQNAQKEILSVFFRQTKIQFKRVRFFISYYSNKDQKPIYDIDQIVIFKKTVQIIPAQTRLLQNNN